MTVGGPPNMVPTIQATDKHVESLRIPWLDVGSIPTGSTGWLSLRVRLRSCRSFKKAWIRSHSQAPVAKRLRSWFTFLGIKESRFRNSLTLHFNTFFLQWMWIWFEPIGLIYHYGPPESLQYDTRWGANGIFVIPEDWLFALPHRNLKGQDPDYLVKRCRRISQS